MSGKDLKIKILMAFAMMLGLAMCLQSIILIFLGVRASIRENVAWTNRTLQSFAMFATYMADSKPEMQKLMTAYERLQEDHSDSFSCLQVELAGDMATGISSCLYPDELLAISKQAKATCKSAGGFAGSNWHVFLIRSEVAQLAIPLKDKRGLTIGTISAERSLLPIYSRYEKETWFALCYLLVNTAIFCILGFFRMEKILFKPLDKLVVKAENYSPDQQTLFLPSNDDGAFRKLSSSLNILLDRIERDNRKLRLTVSELEAANKELKEKNDLVVRSEKLASVGRLSAGLAHEIGNPLTIIQGYVELLSRDDLGDDEKRQFSQKAQQELDRIKKLIRQLLDFAGPMRLNAEMFSVNTLISDVISFVSLEKSFALCNVITQLVAEHDELMTDRDALRQVLLNCLLNAADATDGKDEKAREIFVATYNSENTNTGVKLVISVRDNGVGIAESNLENVFDPFFTTKEVGLGTGLGLFVCHTIMERIGGAISLANLIPSGIEVKLELPVKLKSLPNLPPEKNTIQA